MSTDALWRLFRPAEKLLGKLRYRHKFALIGLVLMVPALIAGKAYLDQQGAQIDFSAKERTGMEYVQPANSLLLRLVDARSAAVRRAAGTAEADAELATAVDGVRDALEKLVAADAEVGAQLATTKDTRALKALIERAAAGKPRAPRAAFELWSEPVTATAGLVVTAGNNSNLILDPDLDSFYLMDAAILKIPTLADAVGQVADLETILAAEGLDANSAVDTRIEIAVAKGIVDTNAAGAESGYKTSFEETSDSELEPALDGPIAGMKKTAAGVSEQGAAAVKGTPDTEAGAAAGRAAVEAIRKLEQVNSPQLDKLLATRIDGFESDASRIKLIAAVAVLLALWLFVGFYRSVVSTIRVIVERLGLLESKDVADLQGGLDAMSNGDLTVAVRTTTVPIDDAPGDELGDVARAVNGIRDRTEASVAS
jgi:methyl-accepting chemotaxis protein